MRLKPVVFDQPRRVVSRPMLIGRPMFFPGGNADYIFFPSSSSE